MGTKPAVADNLDLEPEVDTAKPDRLKEPEVDTAKPDRLKEPKVDTAKPDRLKEPNPFDLKDQRRDPQEGLVKAKRLLLEIPVVARPRDEEWFRVHPELEFPARAIDAGRKDYYLATPPVRALLDRFLRPVVIHVIMVRPDEIKLWVRRVKGPEDNENNWWASAQLYAEKAKEQWLQIQAGGDHYIPYSPEGQFSDPDWDPNLTMEEALRMGFRNRMINSLDHPVVVRLLGKKGA